MRRSLFRLAVVVAIVLVAGLLLAHRHYGHLPLGRLIAPSIRLAEEGVVVSKALADSLYQPTKETP